MSNDFSIHHLHHPQLHQTLIPFSKTLTPSNILHRLPPPPILLQLSPARVRTSDVEALGQLVGLVTRTLLKAALPKFVPTILELYKREQDIAFLATCSLHHLLNATLLPENGSPLLDFEDLTVVLSTLLPRLSEAWHNKRPPLIEAITLLLEEKNLGVCKGLAELIVVMASHCYFVGPSGELFVEYLVRHCAMSDQEIDDLVTLKDSFRPTYLYYSFQQKRLEMKIGGVRPTELRAICEKSLLLITITIPEMEHVLWPFMLKMIIPRLYTGAVATDIALSACTTLVFVDPKLTNEIRNIVMKVSLLYLMILLVQ